MLFKDRPQRVRFRNAQGKKSSQPKMKRPPYSTGWPSKSESDVPLLAAIRGIAGFVDQSVCLVDAALCKIRLDH